MKVSCRVRVDADTLEPNTLEPNGEAEIIAEGWQFDDLILDARDEEGVRPTAYVTTHRHNSVVVIPLDLPGLTATKKETTAAVQGGEDLLNFLRPTVEMWEEGLLGKRALLTCDGGCKHPANEGMVRCAKVVRVEFGE